MLRCNKNELNVRVTDMCIRLHVAPFDKRGLTCIIDWMGQSCNYCRYDWKTQSGGRHVNVPRDLGFHGKLPPPFMYGENRCTMGM